MEATIKTESTEKEEVKKTLQRLKLRKEVCPEFRGKNPNQKLCNSGKNFLKA